MKRQENKTSTEYMSNRHNNKIFCNVKFCPETSWQPSGNQGKCVFGAR